MTKPTGKMDRFEYLLKESNDFAVAMGMKPGLLQAIYSADTDWAFIIQTDAVIETAAREAVSKSLFMNVAGESFRPTVLDDFVSSLPMNGRTSLGVLLRAAGCPKDVCEFIEALRQVRNAFAHDIRKHASSMRDVIYAHGNKDQILRRLAPIQKYEKAGWEDFIDRDPRILRYGVFDQTLVFLALAYNVAIKREPRDP